jgi:DNA mismatch repair protein MutL
MMTDTSIKINTNTEGRVRVLPPQEARRIAAGEVVDRPAALVREFLDNAIDSGAANIEVLIEGGGCKKTEVVDDGQGMSREDLELCWLAHATSKIRCLDDLNACESLGFRGEALAAAAASARLEILSCDGGEAWKLEVGPGENNPPALERSRRTRGSTVRASHLFDTIPARKRFLKREGSEAAVCRQAFIDKALAFPEINFRFTQDGRAKDFLPAAASKKERFAAALLESGSFLHEIHVPGEGFSVDVVIGGPELFRADKRMLYVFANGRRIQDYSLTQALIYGTQGMFPNGAMPVGAVYVNIDPALVDFNIHPAKREVRFRDPGKIHHAITTGLRNFFHHVNLKTGAREESPQYPDFNNSLFSGNQPRADSGGGLAMKALLENPADFAPLPGRSNNGGTAEANPVYGEPRYIGRAFNLFILVEWNEKIFIIDQHAAHERILYDRFLCQPVPQQELLVPIPFSTDSEEDDRFLEEKKDELARLAVIIARDGDGWRVDGLPAGWRLGDSETIREILALREAGENMAERWAAALCCHSAVRDGDYLDGENALALAREALSLSEPRCPHGRPVWTEISREALYKAVRRNP